ncbi:translation initiation factor eIF-2B [Natranaeroarchaeum sulfidigenes]|uniref:Translation initiation factor 2B subunit, eIF-2Balpha/beta/delta family n=1 Tax=Natranaeroarchaeum sulfidigenes TaxID=2784880 RepID=A0A897MSK4_9EURY|nr:initiation factor 2B [Natranaeroarchaeum sulfidigenes]QSG03534.1 Translation initiation factor 2B subunit, eIF-2Balpha/beta/delta family [Natranaeroarchaeum sulfidigenes]
MTTFYAVLRHRGDVLVEQGEQGWALPTVEGEDAERAVAGLLPGDVGSQQVRIGAPIGDDQRRPVLFDLPERPTVGAERAWRCPTTLLDEDAAPGAWDPYERVAPTVRSIAADDEHGAAYLSVRALEVLRDRATLLAAEGERDPDELHDLGRRLLRARPSMAVLRNRVNRALNEAGGADDEAAPDARPTSEAIQRAATAGIEGALDADAEAAAAAAELIEGDAVLTLSRSGTVLDALGSATLSGVFVAESRPAREGIDVAERLAAEHDAPVTVHTDAATVHVVATEDVDAVLVGADTILPDGRVINKTGTCVAALAAAREGVPVYVVTASDKVSHESTVNLESGDTGAVYDGEADLDVLNPTFDVTPGELVAGVITERGVLDDAEIETIAEEHAAAAAWQDPPSDGHQDPREAEWE